MSRIQACFRRLRAAGETALVPFVTAGDPDLDTTAELVWAMVDAGADLIELGVPFSDPLADGPTIQRSSERSLAAGTTLRKVLDLVQRIRARTEAPLVLMGSANPFYAMGARAFPKAAAEVGVDGILVPDLPPEEGEDLYQAAEEKGLDAILLAAPTTTESRLAMLVQRSRGFLYYVSLTGVTGARDRLAPGLAEGVAAVRKLSELPVCVGFGISTPAHAARIAALADGAVVGSALVDRLEASQSRSEAVRAVADFVAALKAPLRAG